MIGTDIAASEFMTKDGRYDLDFKTDNNDGKQVLTGEALGELYKDLCRKYPIISVEDPFDQVSSSCTHRADWAHVLGNTAY